jgi:hypothetical protein
MNSGTQVSRLACCGRSRVLRSVVAEWSRRSSRRGRGQTDRPRDGSRLLRSRFNGRLSSRPVSSVPICAHACQCESDQQARRRRDLITHRVHPQARNNRQQRRPHGRRTARSRQKQGDEEDESHHAERNQHSDVHVVRRDRHLQTRRSTCCSPTRQAVPTVDRDPIEPRSPRAANATLRHASRTCHSQSRS